MKEKGRQWGSHEMRVGLAGELRQGAVMTVRLIPVVGRRVLLHHVGCACCSCIACRCHMA